MLWKCCTQYASKFGRLRSDTGLTGKGQFSFQSQRKAIPNNAQLHTIALISHASKVMLKILQASLRQYVNCKLPDVQVGFVKSKWRQRSNCQQPLDHRKSKRVQKNIYFCFIDYTKAFDCVDHNKLWKILKEIGYQTIWPASWEICVQIKKQQLELDTEQQTGSKLGKEYVKAIYCHSAYLTYMQSTSYEMLGWMKHKLESRLLGEISITSDMQMIPHLWQKGEKN